MATYIEHLNDLNEIRVADNLVDGAHLKHDDIVGAPCQALRDCPALNELGPQDVKDGLENKLDKGNPVTLFYPLIYAVHTRGNEMPLVRRCASL